MKKTLYLISSELAWGEVWVDKDAELVGYIHENDAHYRKEYMNFIPEFFGGRVVQLDNCVIEKDVDDNATFDDGEEYVKEFKKEILKQIKKAK